MTVTSMNGHQGFEPKFLAPGEAEGEAEPLTAPFTAVPRLRRVRRVEPLSPPFKSEAAEATPEYELTEVAPAEVAPTPIDPDGPDYGLIDGPRYDPPKPEPTPEPAPGWFARHRPPRAVIAAIPVLAVNACAFLGQLGYLRTHLLTWGLPGQLLVAFALESMAVYLSYHAHVARLADDSVFRVQSSAYSLAIVIAAMNYSHWAGPHWHPTPIAVTFALMSAASPWLWGVHSRRESRDALKARGLIEGHAVRLGANRWFWYPLRAVRVTRIAAWEGITNPAEAIALDRAAELPATEMEPAQLAAMQPRERLIWAWGVIGSTDVPKACALLANLGAPIDPSNARAIRRKLAEAAAVPAIEDGQQ